MSESTILSCGNILDPGFALSNEHALVRGPPTSTTWLYGDKLYSKLPVNEVFTGGSGGHDKCSRAQY